MKFQTSSYVMYLGMVLTPVLSQPTMAREIAYRETDSGTFLNNPLDVNQDGSLSATATYVGKTPFGTAFGRGVSEFAPTAQKECPAGTAEFELVKDSTRGVRRFANGDLLFTQQSQGRFCLDFATGEFTATSQADYVGGTGRFAEASGSNQLVIKGKTLVNQGFSAFTADIKGTLIIPDSYFERTKSSRYSNHD